MRGNLVLHFEPSIGGSIASIVCDMQEHIPGLYALKRADRS